MRGFTLIETIVSISIFIIVMAAIGAMVLNLYHIYFFGWKQSQAIEEAKKGVKTMVKEIRRATMADNGTYVIEDAQDFQFVFYSDEDKDGDVERVRYFIKDNYFKKGVIEPQGTPAVYSFSTESTVVLSQYIRNTPPIFRYYDGEGNELPPPARRAETKLMRLTLEIDVSTTTEPSAFILTSEAQIRNIKTNL